MYPYGITNNFYSYICIETKALQYGFKNKRSYQRKGMTITELADKMGINRVNLSNMVNGNPTVETLNKIADAIGCPVTELFEQPKKDALTLTCPNCGKDINIKVE